MVFSPFDDVMFVIGPIFIFIISIVILGIFIVAIISSVKQWKKNNDSPVLSVDAVVVAKRTNVSHHHHDNMSSSSSTTYYVTFELDSSDRIELRMKGAEYGMLIEQDRGRLTFQGTRYLGFKRI